jgi:hypothetical protein
MKSILFSIAGFASIFFLAVLLTLYLDRESRPVAVCSLFSESPNSYVRHCVPNPFRDKKPELTAESILRQLKNGDVESVRPYLQSLRKDPENARLTKEVLTYSSWEIINREMDGNIYKLAYRARSENGEQSIIFRYTKTEDEWRLESISAYY